MKAFTRKSTHHSEPRRKHEVSDNEYKYGLKPLIYGGFQQSPKKVERKNRFLMGTFLLVKET